MAVQIARNKKLSDLQKHASDDCGCSVLSSPNFCIYQPFLDGWDFTPDVGNGGKRGEVFTPRFIVDKMIVDSGMLPEAAVYNYDYTTLGREAMIAVVHAKVNEPAIGTGNFSSTILWHKIHYVFELAKNKRGRVDVKKYNLYLLEAIASMYSNDIDAGNLETSKWRFLRLGGIYTEKNVKFWTETIFHALTVVRQAEGYSSFIVDDEVMADAVEVTVPAEVEAVTSTTVDLDAATSSDVSAGSSEPANSMEPQSAMDLSGTLQEPAGGDEAFKDEQVVAEEAKSFLEAPEGSDEYLQGIYAAVEQQVRESLNAADENWAAADEDRGIIDVLYRRHTGQNPTIATRHLWKEILDENMKLFNGIVETDTVTEGFIVPGWINVQWTWWGFQNWRLEEGSSAVDIQRMRVPLAKQILEGRLEALNSELETIEAKREDVDDDMGDVPVFTSDADKKAYSEKRRQIRQTEKKIQQLEAGVLDVKVEAEESKTMTQDQGMLF